MAFVDTSITFRWSWDIVCIRRHPFCLCSFLDLVFRASRLHPRLCSMGKVFDNGFIVLHLTLLDFNYDAPALNVTVPTKPNKNWRKHSSANCYHFRNGVWVISPSESYFRLWMPIVRTLQKFIFSQPNARFWTADVYNRVSYHSSLPSYDSLTQIMAFAQCAKTTHPYNFDDQAAHCKHYPGFLHFGLQMFWSTIDEKLNTFVSNK